LFIGTSITLKSWYKTTERRKIPIIPYWARLATAVSNDSPIGSCPDPTIGFSLKISFASFPCARRITRLLSDPRPELEKPPLIKRVQLSLILLTKAALLKKPGVANDSRKNPAETRDANFNSETNLPDLLPMETKRIHKKSKILVRVRLASINIPTASDDTQ